MACQGRPAWRRTERLVAAADGLAHRLGHPHALGMASLSAGAAEFLIGRYDQAVELLNRAEAIFRERCTGVIWELDTDPDLLPLVTVLPGAPGRARRSAATTSSTRRATAATGTWSPRPGPSSGPSSAWLRTTSRAHAGSPAKRWDNGRIKAFTSSISIFIMGAFILTRTPAMRPPPGGGSRKPSRSWSRRSCCGSSRSSRRDPAHRALLRWPWRRSRPIPGRCFVARRSQRAAWSASKRPGPVHLPN